MALTGEERLIVFEILDLIPGGQATEFWGELGRSQAVQNYSFRSPAEAVDFHIAALTADAETRVRELLDQWSEVSTDESSLKVAEEIEGVVADSEARRGLIRKRLQVYIPVFLEGEIRQRHGNRGNLLMRG